MQSDPAAGELAPIGSSLPPPPPGEIMEAARRGRLLGITPKQIERLTALGMPHTRGVRGQLRYNTAQVWAWWGAYNAGSPSLPGAGPASLQDERARLARAQTERVELQTATLRRELLPYAEVHNMWHFALTNLRTRLLAIPAKLAPTILLAATPAIAQQQIDRVIRDALAELADVPRQLGGQPGDGGTPAGSDGGAAAAAAADDLAMGGHP